MIQVRGSDGTVLTEVPFDKFPLEMDVLSPTGLRKYKIHLNFVRDREGNKTEKTKNINVTIDRD